MLTWSFLQSQNLLGGEAFARGDVTTNADQISSADQLVVVLAFGAAAGRNRSINAFAPGEDIQHREGVAGIAHGDGRGRATIMVEGAAGNGAGGEGCRHDQNSFLI